MSSDRYTGHGIGLRHEHYNAVLEQGLPAGVSWVEAISENFFGAGGRPLAVLERARSSVPVVIHGVSLGLGNVDPLDERYLVQLRDLIARIEPAAVSDHLCWGAFGGHHAHDLLPLPFNEETLLHVVNRIIQVQERLRRRLLLENVSSYVCFRESEMSEPEFLAEIARRADCHLLLDLNNIVVSARNHGWDVTSYLNVIPPDRVGHFHLAGHTDHGSFVLDSHIGPVPAPVWDVYRQAVRRFGPRPTLVEWDEEVPELDVVAAEARRAAHIEAEALHG